MLAALAAAAFIGPPRAQDVDLAALVPARGRIDHVWYVPAGRGLQQVVVGWRFRGRPVLGWSDDTRYVLSIWTGVRRSPGETRWVPQTLIHASPFPFFDGTVRLADVTHDGHADLLVTVYCSDCNHGAAALSIYGTFGSHVRHIWGDGILDAGKTNRPSAFVRGDTVIETYWGARDGVVWFNVGGLAGTPRTRSFMRWTPHGWRTVRHPSAALRRAATCPSYRCP